jgi:cytochrome c biogenesis protein CcdA
MSSAATNTEVCKTGGLQSLNLTPFAVACGAAVDAINPCALSILILLMASLLVDNERKKALKTGLAFIAAVYLAYFLMGLGFLSILRNYTLSFSGVFYKIVGVAAIIFGLLNIKDFFWYGKVILMEVPLSWRPKMKELIFKVTSPWGSFAVGLIVSLFLLPCLSGPYAVILAMLAAKKTFLKAFIYMLAYNLIFVLPMLIIVFAMYFGLPPEKAEEWRKGKLRLLHLIAGIILVALGVVILGGWL